MKGYTIEEFLTLLRFWLKVEVLLGNRSNADIKVDYSHINMGVGIIFDTFSLDNGETWYLYYKGRIILEDDFILGMNIYNYLGCAAARLS